MNRFMLDGFLYLLVVARDLKNKSEFKFLSSLTDQKFREFSDEFDNFHIYYSYMKKSHKKFALYKTKYIKHKCTKSS